MSIVQLPRTPAPEQDVPRSEWPRTEEVVHLGYVGGWHGRVILRLAVGHPGGYLYRAHLDYPTGEGARVEHWVTPDAGFEVEGAYAQAEELVFEPSAGPGALMVTYAAPGGASLSVEYEK